MSLGNYRICNLDIENFPNRGYAWEQFDKYPSRQNLIAIDRPWCMASFAYKWEGEDGDPTCYALPSFKKTYKNNPFDDSELLLRMWDILEEADLVVGHNIDQFDIRKINARLWQAEAVPPLTFRTYDTLKEARKLFLLPSYSLDSIAKFLGCPYQKIEHEGFPLWEKCMGGDMEAWGRFIEYNKMDVRVDEWIYHRIRPWSRTHPNITLKGDEDNRCPVCGYKTKEVDWYSLKSYQVVRYRCIKKSCGKTSFGRRAKLDIQVLTS